MNIKDYINSLVFSCEDGGLGKLDALLSLKTTHVNISFWGTRTLSNEKYKGSISLDTLSQQILELGKRRSEFDVFTPRVRLTGLEITRKLSLFYTISDFKLLGEGRLAKLINCICDIVNRFFNIVTVRYEMGEYGNARPYFSGFSPKKFVHDIDDDVDFRYSTFFCGNIKLKDVKPSEKEHYLRIIVPEQILQELANDTNRKYHSLISRINGKIETLEAYFSKNKSEGIVYKDEKKRLERLKTEFSQFKDKPNPSEESLYSDLDELRKIYASASTITFPLLSDTKSYSMSMADFIAVKTKVKKSLSIVH